MMDNTYKKYFVVKRINKNLSYDKIYKEQYDKYKNYNEKHVSNARKIDEKTIELEVRDYAKRTYEILKEFSLMKYVIVEFGKEEEKIKEIEEIEGENFINWL
jgi:hypothetical protein